MKVPQKTGLDLYDLEGLILADIVDMAIGAAEEPEPQAQEMQGQDPPQVPAVSDIESQGPEPSMVTDVVSDIVTASPTDSATFSELHTDQEADDVTSEYCTDVTPDTYLTTQTTTDDTDVVSEALQTPEPEPSADACLDPLLTRVIPGTSENVTSGKEHAQANVNVPPDKPSQLDSGQTPDRRSEQTVGDVVPKTTDGAVKKVDVDQQKVITDVTNNTTENGRMDRDGVSYVLERDCYLGMDGTMSAPPTLDSVPFETTARSPSALSSEGRTASTPPGPSVSSYAPTASTPWPESKTDNREKLSLLRFLENEELNKDDDDDEFWEPEFRSPPEALPKTKRFMCAYRTRSYWDPRTGHIKPTESQMRAHPSTVPIIPRLLCLLDIQSMIDVTPKCTCPVCCYVQQATLTYSNRDTLDDHVIVDQGQNKFVIYERCKPWNRMYIRNCTNPKPLSRRFPDVRTGYSWPANQAYTYQMMHPGSVIKAPYGRKDLSIVYRPHKKSVTSKKKSKIRKESRKPGELHLSTITGDF